MARKQDKGINPELESAIENLLEDMKSNPDYSLTDKMKILDRALKLEAIKLKVSDDGWGSGLLDEQGEDE